MIEDGRFDQSHRVAFIMTRQVGRSLPEEGWPDVRQWATTYPVAAFEQFSLLVDALSQLHGTRIVHRNLTLAAIRMRHQPGKASQASLSLARFELSALLNNLLHSVNGPQGRHRYEEAMRALFRTPPQGITPAQHLAYIAPETYPSVFGDVRSRRLDHGSTDVFGLGVLGWELFLGSLTERLPEECAAVDAAGPDELPHALVRLHSAMRRDLNVDNRLPRPLRAALLDMLDPSPAGRSSSFEASAALQRHWTAISLALEKDEAEEQPKRPRLVAFMPEQSVGTIHEARGWTDHRTDTPEGCRELKEFLEQELKQAELVHCPGGAEGYVQDGDRRALSEAEWVLIGAQAVWFCAYLYKESVMGRRTETYDDTLVIKYLLDKRHAGDLLKTWPRRRIGRFDLVPFYLGKSLDHERRDRPSWRELTGSVAVERVHQDAGVQRMLRSFAFMLEYRGIVLKSRNYPYRLVKDDGRLVLTHDKDRDRRWLYGDPLLTAYAAPAGGADPRSATSPTSSWRRRSSRISSWRRTATATASPVSSGPTTANAPSRCASGSGWTPTPSSSRRRSDGVTCPRRAGCGPTTTGAARPSCAARSGATTRSSTRPAWPAPCTSRGPSPCAAAGRPHCAADARARSCGAGPTTSSPTC